MNKKLALVFMLILVIFLSGCTGEGELPVYEGPDGAPTEFPVEEPGEEKSKPPEETEVRDLPSGKCSEPIIFQHAPADLDKVLFIEPLGAMAGNHVTPVDHQYYRAKEDMWVDVYSPVDGVVTNIQHMGSIPGDDSIQIDDYRIVIKHTCSVSSIFIHIDELSDKLMEAAPPLGEYASTNVEVKAGEILGRYDFSLDYNVVDYDVELEGFVIPESYNEEWKMHIPDPFDYFNEDIKNKMTSLCLRSAEPVGGKIDYDIEGKLVGTWFVENTNKYKGLGIDGYWLGHMTIAYDSIDPEHITISIGGYGGKDSEQFGVKGNAPDPKDVGIEDGVVKYELTGFDYHYGNDYWDRNSQVKGIKVKNKNEVKGVILFQVLENNKLKMETFDGKTAEQVSGFTDNAVMYER